MANNPPNINISIDQVKSGCLDFAIRACGPGARPEAIVEAARIFMSFVAGEKSPSPAAGKLSVIGRAAPDAS